MASIIQSNQDGPASGVQEQKQDLNKSILTSNKQNLELASENAALKKQLASKESSWEMEKSKILKSLQSERAIRRKAQADLKAKVKETNKLETTKSESQTETITILQDLKRNIKESQNTNIRLASQVTDLKQQMASKESSWQQEKDMFQQTVAELEKVIRSLQQNLLDEQEKSLSAYEELNHVTVNYEELDSMMRTDLNTKWETKWCQEQEKMALKFQTLEENSVRELSQVIQEKDDQVAKITCDKKALEAESLEYKTRLEELERKFIQSEAEWKIKLTTLEDQKRSELSSEEGSSWVLTQNNPDLQFCDPNPQELQQTAEKVKVELTKADIKAKEEAAMNLEKERKEKEEREEENAKNEKQEKEELKRQKKEEKPKRTGLFPWLSRKLRKRRTVVE